MIETCKFIFNFKLFVIVKLLRLVVGFGKLLKHMSFKFDLLAYINMLSIETIYNSSIRNKNFVQF